MHSTMTGSSTALRSALESLRLEGAIFLRGEYTETWEYESPAPEQFPPSLLHPGAERLTLFHIVAEGNCWIAMAEGERHWATRGDVIVLPYGDQHRMGGRGTSDECVSLASLLTPPPWDQMPVISYGHGGARTGIVCGYLHSDNPLFDPDRRAFPPVFVTRPASKVAAQWVEASIAYALEHSSAPGRSESFVATRLPELLLIEVLRQHFESTPATERGWVAALSDPVLGPAMAHLHRDPARKWTVAELAAETAVSRSLLDERFRKVLGRSPIRYLTEWRMHLAEEALARTNANVGAVARRVGYESEEAFSRAFKRAHGVSPAHWREERAGNAVAPQHTGRTG